MGRLRFSAKWAVKATSAWIGTFIVAFIAWYVSLYTDYGSFIVLFVFIIIAIGAYACWQTIPPQAE